MIFITCIDTTPKNNAIAINAFIPIDVAMLVFALAKSTGAIITTAWTVFTTRAILNYFMCSNPEPITLKPERYTGGSQK